MTPLDTFFLLLTGLLTARGIWTGFTRQIAFLAALPLGFWAASGYYDHFGHILAPLITAPELRFMVSYLLLFCLVYLLLMLAAVVVRKVLKFSMMGWLDRLLGGALGLVKGVLICSLIFMGLAALLSDSAVFLGRSKSYPFFKESSGLLVMILNDAELRKDFQPSQPAITDLLDFKRDKTDQELDRLRYRLAREAGEKPRK